MRSQRVDNMRRLIIFAFTILLTGCTVGPDYVRPIVDVPTSFRYRDKEVQDTANTEWWKQFHDPVLDELISEALTNNKNIKIAAANVEQAAAVLMQAQSPLFPQIGYSGSGTKERASEEGATPLPRIVTNPQTSYQALSSISWECGRRPKGTDSVGVSSSMQMMRTLLS